MKRNLNKQITLIFETLLTRLSIHIGLACSAKSHFLHSGVLPRKASHTQLVPEAEHSEEVSPEKCLWRKCSHVPGTPRTLSQETRLNLSYDISWHPTVPKMIPQPCGISHRESAYSATLSTSQGHRAMPLLLPSVRTRVHSQRTAYCVSALDKDLWDVERSWTIFPPI